MLSVAVWQGAPLRVLDLSATDRSARGATVQPAARRVGLCCETWPVACARDSTIRATESVVAIRTAGAAEQRWAGRFDGGFPGATWDFLTRAGPLRSGSERRSATGRSPRLRPPNIETSACRSVSGESRTQPRGYPDRMPGSRWTSFIADPDRRRILHEDGNEVHRLRVEHDRARLYVELSGEDGGGPWIVLAVDRASRRHAVAQAETKTAATQAAAQALTDLLR